MLEESERFIDLMYSLLFTIHLHLSMLPRYDTAIDMWSFGCILAECEPELSSALQFGCRSNVTARLYTGYPLFPGENEALLLVCHSLESINGWLDHFPFV